MKETIDTFFRRLKGIAEPDLHDIELAYVLSKFAHRHQTRKELDPDTGRPLRYFEHTRRAALVLIDEARIHDPTLVICALLHDGMEDTRLINFPRIKHWFGREVAETVRLLTKEKGVDYVERLRESADWRALILKACDRLDNLRSLGAGSKEFQVKQVKETKEKYLPLFDLMVSLTPRKHQRGVDRVRNEIGSVLRLFDV